MIGTYTRIAPPHRIQRFKCKHCNGSFSSQTFSTTYWQKMPYLDQKIFMKTIGGMANRQIARDLGVAPSTVDRHIARLGRHCMLYHQQMMEDAPPVSVVVVDGFESFELSQYYPFHHHVAVEKGTDFFIYFTDSELRRKGRMTDHQKQRRSELEKTYGRPDPKAVEMDMAELITVSLRRAQSAVVYSDDHRAYPRSLRKVRCRISHRITPGREHRDQNNSLWEVNLLDLLIRHSNANHRRETLAWSKRRQASSERLAILLVWRNYIKGRREKVRGSPTPAMERGMLDRPLRVIELLKERIFRSLCWLPPRWRDYYERTVRTRALGTNNRHSLAMAF